MIPLLAEADNASIGLVVQSLTAVVLLLMMLLQLYRGAGSKEGQRQIEPTEMHAVVTELKAQTVTLNKLDRESGETRQMVGAVDAKVTAQNAQVENAFRRINAISIESASVKDRLNDHLSDHREGRRNA
jgi:hypothetical protein